MVSTIYVLRAKEGDTVFGFVEGSTCGLIGIRSQS